MSTHHEVTEILERVSAGEERALDELLPLVYEELRRLAGSYMRREREGHTLQPTALMHEAFIRLHGGSEIRWESRAHFMAAAARTMRRVLVDHARSKGRHKRGGEWQRVTLTGPIAAPISAEPLDVIALDRALERLAEHDERKARVVELLYLAGLTADEAAHVLGVTSRTIERDWRYARAWLLHEMERSTDDDDDESA